MSVSYLIDRVFPLRVEWKRDDCRPYGQGQDGYGRKIAMPYLCRIGARGPWRRMYCVCFSNAGSCYVMVGAWRCMFGTMIFLRRCGNENL
jgi:hypothetical protein